MSDEETMKPSNEDNKTIGGTLLDRINEGSKFSFKQDPDDPCFDVITMRIPNARIKHGPEAAVLDPAELTGFAARMRQARYVVANASGVVRDVLSAGGADADFVQGVGQIFATVQQNIRAREIAGPMKPNEQAYVRPPQFSQAAIEEDVDAKLAAIAAEADAHPPDRESDLIYLPNKRGRLS